MSRWPSNFSERHGLSSTRTYKIWAGIVKRCTNTKAENYPLYGGRGITMCDRWRRSFSAFLEDMGQAPDGMSIERIDCNGNYEPSNCKWATLSEQANNTRKSRFVEWHGKKYTIAQLAAAVGLTQKRVWHRLNEGWSVEQAVQPPMKKRRKVTPAATKALCG